MKRGVWVALSVAAVLVAGGLYRASAQETTEATAAPAFAPASPLADIMEVNGDEFKQLRKSLKPRPNFKKIGHAAHVIAEIGNIAAYHQPTSETNWWQYADQLKITALEIANAADEKNADGLGDMVKKLGNTCKACHDQYKKN